MPYGTTLWSFTVGAGAHVVGVTDYCSEPTKFPDVVRAGSAVFCLLGEQKPAERPRSQAHIRPFTRKGTGDESALARDHQSHSPA